MWNIKTVYTWTIFIAWHDWFIFGFWKKLTQTFGILQHFLELLRFNRTSCSKCKSHNITQTVGILLLSPTYFERKIKTQIFGHCDYNRNLNELACDCKNCGYVTNTALIQKEKNILILSTLTTYNLIT